MDILLSDFVSLVTLALTLVFWLYMLEFFCYVFTDLEDRKRGLIHHV